MLEASVLVVMRTKIAMIPPARLTLFHAQNIQAHSRL